MRKYKGQQFVLVEVQEFEDETSNSERSDILPAGLHQIEGDKRGRCFVDDLAELGARTS